jgi:hypothetical protein
VSRAIGSVALVEPGVEAWSKTRIARDEGAVGGIVIYVTEQADRDTGELERAFVCLDHTRTRPWLRWTTLPEHDVDPDTVMSVDITTLVHLWRRLGEELAFKDRHKPRRGPATPDEARVADAIHVLIGLVFGADGPLYGVLTPPQPAKPTPPPAPARFDAGVFVD